MQERKSKMEKILHLPKNEFLKKMMEYESKCEDEKDVLTARIKELENENIEFRKRFVIIFT